MYIKKILSGNSCEEIIQRSAFQYWHILHAATGASTVLEDFLK